MFRKMIVALTLLVCSTSLLHAGWGSDERLTNDTSVSLTTGSNAWCVAATSASNVFVVWTDERDGNKEIYYKHRAQVWSSDIRLTEDSNTSQAPCVAVTSSNNHVVWTDDRDGNVEIYYKKIDLGTSSKDKRLTVDTARSYSPSLAVSGSFLHTVWCDDRDAGHFEIYYKRSKDSGSGWSSDTRISVNDSSGSITPSIAVVDSVLHVAWVDTRDGNFEIYYDRSWDKGNTWGNDIRLTSNDSSSSWPCIAASGSNVHVVWMDDRDGNHEIYYIRSINSGSNWGSVNRLTTNSFTSKQSSIAVSDSNIHVVWADNRDGNFEIYYKQSTNNGASWGADTRLTSNDSASTGPSVASIGGYVFVVWTDERDGNKEIYFKEYTPDNEKKSLSRGEKVHCQNLTAYRIATGIRLEGIIGEITPLTLQLYDITGREVASALWEPVSESFSFDWQIYELSAGVYFVTVSQKNSIRLKSGLVWLK